MKSNFDNYRDDLLGKNPSRKSHDEQTENSRPPRQEDCGDSL